MSAEQNPAPWETVVGKHDPTGSPRVRAADRGKPLAGKSTLNRLELTLPDGNAAERYKKIVAQPEAIDRLFVEAFDQRRTGSRAHRTGDTGSSPLLSGKVSR